MSFEEWWEEQLKNDVTVESQDYDGITWDYPLGDELVYKEIAELAWEASKEIHTKIFDYI